MWLDGWYHVFNRAVERRHFFGRMSARTRNAEGLEAILADFFEFRR
jgi:hypothetical protein